MLTAKQYAELLAILLKNSNLGPIEKENEIENYSGSLRRSSDRK